MDSRVKGMSRLAAGAMAVLAAGVAGCGSSHVANQPPMTPVQAIQLAARTTGAVNSFVGTINIQISTSSGAGTIAGTFTEQLHPTVLAKADFPTFSVAGMSLAGGMGEILTSNTLYLRMSLLTQALHTGKTWLQIPFSALNSIGGVNLGSLLNQLQNNNPLTQSMMFAGANDVHVVGSGTVDGVPVTEYAGTISVPAALAKLPANIRTSISPALTKAGINSMRFTAWVDDQHLVRKSVVVEAGTLLNETITTNITSVNQPVNIQVPPASQTSMLPAGALNSSGTSAGS